LAAWCLGFDLKIQRQNTFVLTAHHRQDAVAGRALIGFIMVKIIGKLGAFGLFSRHNFARKAPHCRHMPTQTAQKIGVFRQGLGDDIARTIERGLSVWHRIGDERGCKRNGIRRAVGQNGRQ
jgi:hypothetical protein